MDNETVYYDMDLPDLEREIVGKRVIEVDTNDCKIYLEDGTILDFQDESDCCAWFAVQLKKGNLVNNLVTSVKLADWDSRAEEYWALHILAEDNRICDVLIEGDSTSGYYCRSITLEVTRAS